MTAPDIAGPWFRWSLGLIAPLLMIVGGGIAKWTWETNERVLMTEQRFESLVLRVQRLESGDAIVPARETLTRLRALEERQSEIRQDIRDCCGVRGRP